jgi:membrane-associated phospholipid phosphatase
VGDTFQQAIQALAYANPFWRAAAIFCAAVLLYLLVLAWVAAVYLQRRRLTMGVVARVVLLFGLSYGVAKLAGHVILDPRPYLVQQIAPLIPLAHDNGFPSDHSLLAWALALSLIWLAPPFVWPFAAGAVLVMLGRLGIAAHHTLDVGGSALIVLVVALLVARLPLPAGWHRPLLRHPRWPRYLRVPE